MAYQACTLVNVVNTICVGEAAVIGRGDTP